jgi:hypothetical protein
MCKALAVARDEEKKIRCFEAPVRKGATLLDLVARAVP